MHVQAARDRTACVPVYWPRSPEIGRSGPAVTGDRPHVHAVHPHVLTGVGRVDHLTVAHVQGDVMNVAVVEDEITRREIGPRYVADRAVLAGRVVRQGNPG